MAAQIKRMYEGENVRDGEYKLGQLTLGGYGRVAKWHNGSDYELYNEMPVMMDKETCTSLFNYVKTREGTIFDFKAVVKNHQIIHIYE